MIDVMFNCTCRWEKYQVEEEALLGRGKRQRKAVSYRETFASIPAEALSEVIFVGRHTESYSIFNHKMHVYFVGIQTLFLFI